MSKGQEEIKENCEKITIALMRLKVSMDKKRKEFFKLSEAMDKDYQELFNKLGEMRLKCTHDFGNKRLTMMGHGICIICGKDDY